MNGQRISEMLNNIDDDLLADALPPAWRTGKIVPPKKTRHPFRALGRILDNGWVVAALSIVISAAVLGAAIWAGQNLTGPGIGPGGNPGTQSGTQSGTSAGNESSEGTYPDTLPWPDAPVVMHLNGEIYVDHMVGIYSGYMVYESVDDHEKGEGYDADGEGALYRLDELSADLKRAAVSVPESVSVLSFTLRDDFSKCNRITVCDPSGTVIDEQSLSMNGARLKLANYRKAGHEGIFVILSVRTDYTTPTYEKCSVYEYPVYLIFTEGEVVTTPPVDDPYEIPPDRFVECDISPLPSREELGSGWNTAFPMRFSFYGGQETALMNGCPVFRDDGVIDLFEYAGSSRYYHVVDTYEEWRTFCVASDITFQNRIFGATIRGYNGAFFQTHSLVMLLSCHGTGSAYYTDVKPEVKDGRLHVELNFYSPMMGTEDMAGRVILIPVEKSVAAEPPVVTMWVTAKKPSAPSDPATSTEPYNIVYGEPQVEGFGLTFREFVEEINSDGETVISKMSVDFYNYTDTPQVFYRSFVLEYLQDGVWVRINEGMDFPAALYDVAPGQTQLCTYRLTEIDLSRPGTYRFTADEVMSFTFELGAEDATAAVPADSSLCYESHVYAGAHVLDTARGYIQKDLGSYPEAKEARADLAPTEAELSILRSLVERYGLPISRAPI